MAAVLFVRIKSRLDIEELERRALERRPQFLEVPGLLQKIYVRDEASDEVAGIYFFESREALEDYAASDLCKTIASAYEAEHVRREVYDVMYPLRPERGPLVG